MHFFVLEYTLQGTLFTPLVDTFRNLIGKCTKTGYQERGGHLTGVRVMHWISFTHLMQLTVVCEAVSVCAGAHDSLYLNMKCLN
jgi:hypothetical protein